MNKNVSSLFLLSLLTLTSCMGKVSELYGEDEYLAGELTDYYYVGRDDFPGVSSPSKEQILTIDDYAYGNLNRPLAEEVREGRNSVEEMFPSWFFFLPDNGTINGYHVREQYRSNEYIGRDFGRTECFAVKSPAFQNGIVSRLYDGQLSCHTYHSKAFLNLDETGMKLKFPQNVSLDKGLLFVFRGGMDASASGNARIDFSLSLYYEKEGEYFSSANSYVIENLPVNTNDGGDNVNFLAIPASNFENLTISGVEITYKLTSYPTSSDTGVCSALASDKEADSHFGLLLYEIMAPNASLS